MVIRGTFEYDSEILDTKVTVMYWYFYDQGVRYHSDMSGTPPSSDWGLVKFETEKSSTFKPSANVYSEADRYFQTSIIPNL